MTKIITPGEDGRRSALAILSWTASAVLLVWGLITSGVFAASETPELQLSHYTGFATFGMVGPSKAHPAAMCTVIEGALPSGVTVVNQAGECLVTIDRHLNHTRLHAERTLVDERGLSPELVLAWPGDKPGHYVTLYTYSVNGGEGEPKPKTLPASAVPNTADPSECRCKVYPAALL